MKNKQQVSLLAAILFLLTAVIYLVLFIMKHQAIHIALFSVYVAVSAVFFTTYKKAIASQEKEK